MIDDILNMLYTELALFKEREKMHGDVKNYIMANENKIKVLLTEVYIGRINQIKDNGNNR